MLTIEDLHVRYGSITALKGISMEVREREVVGLIGPNGAGKSTILGTIVGLVKPAGGRITFEGSSIAALRPEDIARRGIALVPEGRQIFGTLTVAENLRLGEAARAGNGDLEGDLERVLQLFPVLRTYYRSSAGKLSGGEQQQLAIARALILRPRLLLLDEPSLGLAPRLVDLVFEVLDQLKEGGVTILLVEQVAARTIRFAERTYVLRNGLMTLSGSRDELLERSDLAEAYMGF